MRVFIATACVAAVAAAAGVARSTTTFHCTSLERTLPAPPTSITDDVKALGKAQAKGDDSAEASARAKLEKDFRTWDHGAKTVVDWLAVVARAQASGDDELERQALANAEAVGIADMEVAAPTQMGGRTAGAAGGGCMARIADLLKKTGLAPGDRCGGLPRPATIGSAMGEHVAEAHAAHSLGYDLECSYPDPGLTQRYHRPTSVDVDVDFEQPLLVGETAAKTFIAAYNPERYAPVGDLGTKNAKAWAWSEELPTSSGAIGACGVFAWLPYNSILVTGQGTRGGCIATAKLIVAQIAHERAAGGIPVVYPPLPPSPGLG